MNYLQAGIQGKKEFSYSRFIIVFHFINLIFICANFALNFLGRPELKYIYLAHAILIFMSVIIFPINKIMPEIITLIFLEGQGRVIWNYQSWARIVFDSILLMSVIKIFIKNKKIYSKEIIPKPFMALILCHFLWYLVQFFNINAASIIGVVAATKIYIFPILLFLGLTQSDLDIKKIDFYYMLGFFILILILELALSIFQLQEKQILLYKISPHYFKALKSGIFTGSVFRPLGTTHLPGNISIFIFLTAGLLYLKRLNLFQSLFRYFIICISIFTLIICQIRSALIKYIMILALIHIGHLIFHRLSAKKLLPYIIVLIFLTFNLDGLLSKLPAFNDKNLEYALARTASLVDSHKLKSSRLNTDTLGSVLGDQLSKYPLGVGPGMTGAASSINEESLAHDPVLNRNTLWTHDSLFVSLVIDMGFGAIFYIILIGLIPVYFAQKLPNLYREKNEDKFRIMLICISTLTVIIIGNWGAIGLTYNPESFFYWFFASIGFYTLRDQNNLTPITTKI